jgi:RNA polymerase sigma-70 factor, ECF subfamily
MSSTSFPSGEAQLLSACKAGNREHFQTLISPYLKSIKLIAYSILQHQQDTEEVVQEAILKAFTHINELRDGESFKAWLLQIAGNEARMRRRKDRKQLYSSVEQEIKEKQFWPRQFIDWRNIPSQELERKEVRDALTAALICLDDSYREVFILRDIEHLSAIETGRILGLTPGAVNTRLHRARLQMREQLTPLFKAPGAKKARIISVNMMRVMGRIMLRKTVSCRHVTRQISNYIDGQVQAELRRQIEEHVRLCHRCSILVDSTRKLLYVAGDEKVFEIPFDCKIKWEQIVKCGDFQTPMPAD